MSAGNPAKRFKKGPMDHWLAKGDSFVMKNPRLFKGHTFTFKGYVPKVRKALEVVVKDMSAKIDDRFGKLITDKYTFASANDGRPHYSIAYLAHSIRAGKPLNIHNYKFAAMKENAVDLGCHCLDVKNILNAKYWPNDQFQNVKCSLCSEAEQMVIAGLKDDDIVIVAEYRR